MSNDITTTRCASARRAADPARLRMSWAVEVGLGRGLVARWDTTDERRRLIDAPHRRSAA